MYHIVRLNSLVGGCGKLMGCWQFVEILGLVVVRVLESLNSAKCCKGFAFARIVIYPMYINMNLLILLLIRTFNINTKNIYNVTDNKLCC